MTHLKAFGITMTVAVVIAIYLALTMSLGIKEYWIGFLFLSQWGLMERCAIDRMPQSIGGAVLGTAISLMPSHMPPLIGTVPALVVVLGVVLWSIYASIMGWLPLVVNPAMMIFLTVITIPEITAGATPAGLFLGLAVGVSFFGGLGLIGTSVARAKGFGQGGSAESATAF